MKKLKSVVVAVLLFIVPVFSVSAAQLLDGDYQGVTSQNESISFSVSQGQITNLGYTIETCSLDRWFLSMTQFNTFNDYFTFSTAFVLDTNGFPISPEAARQNSFFGHAQIETENSVSGELWHALAYFTGRYLDIGYCFDDTVTWQAQWIGVQSNAILPKSEGAEIRVVGSKAIQLKKIKE